MSEKDLNIKYIQDKTGLVDNDELIPIILEMIQESYKAGLCQSEFDNTMGLIEENQELKKQLEEKDILIKQCDLSVSNVMDCYCNRTDCAGRIKDSKQYDSLEQKVENQQKEFIEYLEKTIEELECEDVDDEEMKDYLIQRIYTFKEILSKYKEIIGDDK